MPIELIGGPVPIIVEAVAVVALVVALARRPPVAYARRAGRTTWWVLLAAIALGAGALGYIACWLLGDVFDVFGATLTETTRAWTALGFAGGALAIVALVRGRALRRVAASIGLVFSLLTALLGINADFGQFQTLSAALGSGIDPLPTELLQPRTAADADAERPTTPPAEGRVGTVDIPATRSGFPARPALIYLPPAALVRDPARLPLLIMLPGQPGSPRDIIDSAHLDEVLDEFARAHDGRAPIVVVPDQLGSPQSNPMCVDGPLGNSATYLTVDVPEWIRQHLHVRTDREGWAIAGFSQGGTCAIQLGAAHPELFGGFLDIAGETTPSIGTTAETIARGFRGDSAAYAAAQPAAIMAARAPYAEGMVAVFAYGREDVRFGPGIPRLAAKARAAGMRVTLFEDPSTGHDWYTVQFAERRALPALMGGLQWF